MLTGDILPTSGSAFVNGYSIRTNLGKVCQQIGYCPQFDALFSLLTGVEHLTFYARVQGISEKDIKHVVDQCIADLCLEKNASKLSENLSGGNKRKLSTAIALITNAPVIFFDEPTTGMDPKAKRFLWDCIRKVRNSGRSIVITSHSMEECEALCNRIAIMVCCIIWFS